MRKWIFLILFYLILLLLVYRNREFFVEWLFDSDTTHLVYFFLFSIVVAVFPVIPFTIFAGLMGVKYGWFVGSLINLTGGFTAAMLFFFLARYLFADYYQAHITTGAAKSLKSLARLNHLMERNAFLAVLLARILPIIPTPLINIYSGVSRIRFRTYLAATALGQYPGMFIYAYMGDKLATSWRDFLFGLLFYLLFSALVLSFYYLLVKNKKQIVAE